MSDSEDSEVDASEQSRSMSTPRDMSCRQRHWQRSASSRHPTCWVVPTHATRPSPRRIFWEHATNVFHPDILVSGWSSLPEESRRRQVTSLKYVFRCVCRGLFGASQPTYRDAPPEMQERISFLDLLQQYAHLLDVVIPGLLGGPAGLQCFVATKVFVLLGDGRVIPASTAHVRFAQTCWHGSAWGGDLSIASGCRSAIGRAVVLQHGDSTLNGVLQGFERYVDEEKLYKMLMLLSYHDFVKPQRLWHILRLYHRIFMAGCTTEALAELVGSMLTQRVQCQVGRHISLSDCIGATKLRCAGIRGDTRDDEFIRRSLNIYFRGKPWHFFLSSRRRVDRDKMYPAGLLGSSVALHRHELAVRLKRTFTWLAGGLRDMIRVFGRRDLRVSEDFSASETPRGGPALRAARSLHDLRCMLSTAQARYVPDVVDARAWEEPRHGVCAQRQLCMRRGVWNSVGVCLCVCVCACVCGPLFASPPSHALLALMRARGAYQACALRPSKPTSMLWRCPWHPRPISRETRRDPPQPPNIANMGWSELSRLMPQHRRKRQD